MHEPTVRAVMTLGILAIGGLACGDSDGTSASGAGGAATTATTTTTGAGGGEPVPPAQGTIVLDACRGETGVDEDCTLVTDASACVDAKCSKLVVVFSGGEMGCLSGQGYANVIAGYADRGYAAVCINYFETSEGSAVAPYVDEASRIDLAVREATSGAWAQAYWTGEDLLLEGISHGATAPVILMARTELDEAAHWRGSHFTAGCFFDGIYDTLATADLLDSGAVGGKPCSAPVSFDRVLERYCGPGATAESCDLATNAKAQEDTITGVDTDAFAIRDFALFECGSDLPACVGDIVPGAPIESLCQNIEASPTHTCAFEGLPKDSHLTCHRDHYDACRVWFEGLLPP
jgi:hypothetical protein